MGLSMLSGLQGRFIQPRPTAWETDGIIYVIRPAGPVHTVQANGLGNLYNNARPSTNFPN